MKTIEQASYDALKESPSYVVNAASVFHEGFARGVEFAQRWIPVTEDITDENYKGYVNFKIDNYVSCKKVDSQIEFLNLIDAYGFTHWRPLEYK